MVSYLKKPNFIIFYCDDLGYGDLGCYGSDIETPNIDALADDGIRFTNWYSNSPVCSPSRASLLTGKYPARTGVSQILSGKRGRAGLSNEHDTISSKLKENGYSTAMFGKWHLGTTPETRPNSHGFDDFFGFHAGCVDYYSHIFYWESPPVHDLWENEKEVWKNGQYLTELITEKAVNFIHNQNKEQPFFMYVPYNAPHYPMHAPEKYMNRYSHLPWDRQVMAAMISAVDDGVGEIVQALKSLDQYEDTAIFFSSDNGPSAEMRNWLDGTEDRYYGGSAGIFMGHKGSLFDGGIREPAILSYPSHIPKGHVCHELGMMMDIFPTFLSLASVPYSHAEIDGIDLTDMIMNGVKSPHTQVFWEYNNQLAVRKGNWKLVLNGKLDFDIVSPAPVHLSNLEEDPGERNNVVEQYPEIAEDMMAQLQQWYDSIRNEH